jgi:transcriptional regulator with XRE-family HTH domain
MASRPPALDRTFGTRLQTLRVRAGLSQSELARLSGVTRWTIIRIEQFLREPTWRTAVALADAMGVSVAEFRAEGEGHPPG